MLVFLSKSLIFLAVQISRKNIGFLDVKEISADTLVELFVDTRADEKSIIKGVFGISPLILYFPSKILPGLLISFVAFILRTYANMGEGQQKQKAFTNMHVRFTYSTP